MSGCKANVNQITSLGDQHIPVELRAAQLQRFGAFEIPRQKFLRKVHKAVGQGEPEGAWVMPEGFFPL
jgi:Leu/Phe-tRNA-protein transferase